MARPKGTLKLSSNIELQAGAPLDARSIVSTESELYVAANFEYSYIGMLVSTQDTGDVYILKAKPTTTAANWSKVAGSGDMSNYYTKSQIDAGWYNKEEIDEIVSSVYKPAGSATMATLPTLAANVKGNVYNMTEAFVTTSDFVEGAGKSYPVGTNVAVVDIGDYHEVTPVGNENPSSENWYELISDKYVLSTDTEVDNEKTYYEYIPVYKFDIMSGFVDLSGYQTKMQVTELPTAAAAEEGKIYQYIGSTTSNLVKGFFYTCQEVSPATDPKTYEWVVANVQDMSGEGELAMVLNVTKEAGGINVGASYAAGTVFENLWRDLLNPLENPTLTNPSALLTTSALKLLEIGDSANVTLNASLNRGSIVPANGTSGYRSGVADTYSLNGGDTQATGEFTNVTVDNEHASFTATIAYEAGEQPKDSRGNNYDTALAAGTVTSPALVFEFVNALWANTTNIDTVAKLALVSASAKIKEFIFPAATAANPEIFDVPATWTITAVEVYNTLAGTWETCADEFSITDTTHDDAGNVETAYKRYTCNLGYAMASRKIRIKWS